MTDSQDSAEAGDYRRATLLAKYHREGNQPGMIAIVEETNESGRVAELMRSVMVLHRTFIARFRTTDGIVLLNDWMGGIAALEPASTDFDGIDMVRAAQILDYDGLGDRAAAAATITAALADGRMTQTLWKLLDHYEVALPELSSRAGMEFIDANAAALLDEEYRPSHDDEQP